MQYVINRSNRRLHRLPASESCNTDQIKVRDRYETPEDAVARHGTITYCRRCFPDMQ